MQDVKFFYFLVNHCTRLPAALCLTCLKFSELMCYGPFRQHKKGTTALSTTLSGSESFTTPSTAVREQSAFCSLCNKHCVHLLQLCTCLFPHRAGSNHKWSLETWRCMVNAKCELAQGTPFLVGSPGTVDNTKRELARWGSGVLIFKLASLACLEGS